MFIKLLVILFLISIKIFAKNCLLPGDSLLFGDYLVSNNGLYFLTILNRGNICLYNSTTQTFCVGFHSPSYDSLSLTSSNKFCAVKTNGICYWAPHLPITSIMNNIAYAILSNNGNFLVNVTSNSTGDWNWITTSSFNYTVVGYNPNNISQGGMAYPFETNRTNISILLKSSYIVQNITNLSTNNYS